MNVSVESDPSYVTAWRPFSSQSHQAAPDATAWLCTEGSVNNSSTPPLKKQGVNPSWILILAFQSLFADAQSSYWTLMSCVAGTVHGGAPVPLLVGCLQSAACASPVFPHVWGAAPASVFAGTSWSPPHRGCGQKTVLGKCKKVGQTALVLAEISSPPLNPTRNAFLPWTASWLPWLPTYYSTS